MLQFCKKVAAAMFSGKSQAHWRASRQIGFVFLLVVGFALSVWPQTTPKSKKHKPKAAKAAAQAAPEAAAPPAPPPPLPTPEQMPPRPPTVSYQNGQLSIIAPNSTLSDILQAVKSKTGAAIDIPAGANERVVSRFGPGPARDVLAALLNGSHFNYVMIGSDANPTSVAQVILTPRVGAETPPVNQANGAMPNPGMPQYPGQVMQPQPFPGGQQPVYPQAAGVPQQADDPAADSEQPDDSASQDNANGGDEGAPEQVNQGDGQDGSAQPQVKTPEQLLQELQRQQQIQQQQQQQQPGQVPPPAPPQ
jgi:hypothetical protein